MYKSSKRVLIKVLTILAWLRDKSEPNPSKISLIKGCALDSAINVVTRDVHFMSSFIDGYPENIVEKINLLSTNKSNNSKISDIINDLDLSKQEKNFIIQIYMNNNLELIFNKFNIEYERINNGFSFGGTIIQYHSEHLWTMNKNVMDYFDMIRYMEQFHNDGNK